MKNDRLESLNKKKFLFDLKYPPPLPLRPRRMSMKFHKCGCIKDNYQKIFKSVLLTFPKTVIKSCFEYSPFHGVASYVLS